MKKNFEMNFRVVFFSVAFQDKKEHWSLFFSDQNETTMRVIGLAMHQVRRKMTKEKLRRNENSFLVDYR